MKKYIGTKVIKAEPMTVTEAQVLGVEIKPATVYTKTDIEEYGYFPIYIEKGIGKEFDVYPFTDNNVCKQIAFIKYIHELQHLLFGLGLNSEMEVQVWVNIVWI